MKKIIIVLLFLVIPVVIVQAQDNTNLRQDKSIKIVYRNIVCPDCQGWGWTLGEGIKPSGSFNSNSPNRPAAQPGSVYSGIVRYKCLYCNGTGKISAKFIQ